MSDVRFAHCGVVGVIRQGARFLVIRRSQSVAAPGAYCFPGGGIECGESEEDALRRELDEELSLHSVRPVRCLWRNETEWGVRLAWWLTDVVDFATLRANPAEVAAVHWWTRDEMLRCVQLLDSNRAFLAACQDSWLEIKKVW